MLRPQESSSQAVPRRATGRQSPPSLKGEGGREGHVEHYWEFIGKHYWHWLQIKEGTLTSPNAG